MLLLSTFLKRLPAAKRYLKGETLGLHEISFDVGEHRKYWRR